MYKLRDQLEQIFDEQDKLKAEFEKQKAEYLHNSASVSIKRQSLISNEIENFIDAHYIRDENAKYDLYEFQVNFESYINYTIHDLLRILESFGYIELERDTIGNLAWAKPYIKGFKPK